MKLLLKWFLFLKTNFTPSFKLCITGSPIFGFKIGFFEIFDSSNKAKIEKAKTKHIDQCTPIKLIENPAIAGPNIDPICQTELLQVEAFGYTFFGTISANKEKTDGPINARTNPPRKTSP